MTRQTSFQMTEATEAQLDALKAQGYGTTTDIIRIAIDRMAREESTMEPITETYTKQCAIVAEVNGKVATWAKVGGQWQFDCMGRAPWLGKPDATINEAIEADFLGE